MAKTPTISDEDKARITALAKRLPAYMKLATAIMKDGDVPKSSKALLGVGGAYALSPIDLVPGIIPVAGQLDDAYMLLIGLRKSLESMPPELAEKHTQAAGVSMTNIEEDINLVVSVAGRIARMVITTGARIGRAGKSAVRFATNRIRGRK